MSGCIEAACAWLVAMATWLTPMSHASGLIVNYGGQNVIEGAAAYRDYDLSHYPDRCGVALVTPAHLGRIVWIRVEGSEWVGPCLVVDVQQRQHFYYGVYIIKEIAEITRPMAAHFGFKNGAQGEVWIGACPPSSESAAAPYEPMLEWDRGDPPLIYRNWPEQQIPGEC